MSRDPAVVESHEYEYYTCCLPPTPYPTTSITFIHLDSLAVFGRTATLAVVAVLLSRVI